jgi:MFS family permease
MIGMNETRICYKCDYETNNPLGACPQCGHHLRTTAQIKRLGMLMAALGAFLTLFMGGITVTVAQMVWHPFDPHATSNFTGGPGALLFIFGIFAVVMMFGLTSLAAGIFQIKHGRRNRKLVKTILVLAGVFVAVGCLVQIFL